MKHSEEKNSRPEKGSGKKKKKAAVEFNNKFGFNVSVKLRSYGEFSRAENFEDEYTGGFEE